MIFGNLIEKIETILDQSRLVQLISIACRVTTYKSHLSKVGTETWGSDAGIGIVVISRGES